MRLKGRRNQNISVRPTGAPLVFSPWFNLKSFLPLVALVLFACSEIPDPIQRGDIFIVMDEDGEESIASLPATGASVHSAEAELGWLLFGIRFSRATKRLRVQPVIYRSSVTVTGCQRRSVSVE